jgi:hypothetical protein
MADCVRLLGIGVHEWQHAQSRCESGSDQLYRVPANYRLARIYPRRGT